MFPPAFSLALLRHPTTPAPVVRTIEVHAALTAAGDLELAYCLRGDMARLLIPEPGNPVCAEALWEHTCFEAFVGCPGETAYREYNFSPSGQWAAYAFTDYRQRDETCTIFTPPHIEARLTAGRLEIEARVAADALPPLAATVGLQIGLATVVEAADTIDGSHSYWALRHPAALPDFHQRDGFVCRLAAPPALA